VEFHGQEAGGGGQAASGAHERAPGRGGARGGGKNKYVNKKHINKTIRTNKNIRNTQTILKQYTINKEQKQGARGGGQDGREVHRGGARQSHRGEDPEANAARTGDWHRFSAESI